MGVAWQKRIREERRISEEAETLFGAYWESIDTSLDVAAVRPIDFGTAKKLIERYEWLGNMGTTEYAFGLYHDDVLAGVACFGRTAGTNVYSSICGEKYAERAITLCRGACVHWAHPHAASFLIGQACRHMAAMGYRIFIAYSDPEAGEVGTVYQASNWLYCGTTGVPERFTMPDGRTRDARLVSAYARDRRGGVLRYKRTRAEQKQILIEAGATFHKGTPKHRYVAFYGTRGEIKRMRKLMRWPVMPYPKRAEEGSRESRDLSEVEGQGRCLHSAPFAKEGASDE